MDIFIDTSSLIKLYHIEDGTDVLENLFATFTINNIYLSEITKVEFASTIWKKTRTKEISKEQAKITLELFENDFEKFIFISTDSYIIEQSKILVSKHGILGLRTLDSIQLASAISLLKHADLFLTADKLLKSLLEFEGLNTEIIPF